MLHAIFTPSPKLNFKLVYGRRLWSFDRTLKIRNIVFKIEETIKTYFLVKNYAFSSSSNVSTGSGSCRISSSDNINKSLINYIRK